MSDVSRSLIAEDSRIKAEKRFSDQFEKALRSFIERDFRFQDGGPFAFDYKELKAALPGQIVMCNVHSADLSGGRSVFLMSMDDAAALADLLNMGDGTAAFVAEEHLEPIRDLFKEVTNTFFGDVAKTGGPHLVCDEAKAVMIDISPQDFIGSWTVSDFTLTFDRPVRIVRLTANELIDTLFPPLFNSKKSTGDSATSDSVNPELRKEMGLVMDIELPISIELGRTHMLIRDIVRLAPGSVVELDKLSGEPVDLFVNSKRFARGEVVVIEENFAVRITELINPEERINSSKN